MTRCLLLIFFYSHSIFLFSFIRTVNTANYLRQRTCPRLEMNNTINNFHFMNDLQDARAQRILEDQRRRQALLLLQQQQEIEKTLSEISSQDMRNQHHNNQYYQGPNVNAIDMECRNIIALQEELKRQENRKRVEEVLQAKMQEQALLSQFQKQSTMQQSATEQLLSHFAELNSIVARQEALGAMRNQSNGSQGASSNNNNNSNSNFDLLNRLRNGSPNGNSNNGHGHGSNNFNYRQQDLINSLLSKQRNDGGLQGLAQHLNGQNLGQQASLSDSALLARLSHAAAASNNSLPSATLQAIRNQFGQGNNSSTPNPNAQPNIDQRDILSSLLAGKGAGFNQNPHPPPSSSSAQEEMQQPRNAGAPEIRYFNNGGEVKHNGDVLAQLPGKKRKVMTEQIISIDRSSSTETRNANQARPKKMLKPASPPKPVEVKFEHHAGPPKKRNRNHNLSSQISQITNDDSNSIDSNGSALDNPNGNNGGRSTAQNANEDKEGDKLDAANVLLGLMKR